MEYEEEYFTKTGYATGYWDFEHHKDTEGHVCMKSPTWWMDIIPDYTWLFIGDSGSQDDNKWFYKG